MPVAGQVDTYHLQNAWHNGSDSRVGMWAGADGTKMILTSDVAKRGTYRFYSQPKPPEPKPSGYCTSATGVPEQINLQLAAPDALVVSFVTFEDAAPTAPPTALLCLAGGEGAAAAPTRINGVTHVHKTQGGRVYYVCRRLP